MAGDVLDLSVLQLGELQQRLNGQLPALFAEAFLQDIHPRDGWRASRALREQIAGELAKRMFLESVKRAGGVIHE